MHKFLAVAVLFASFAVIPTAALADGDCGDASTIALVRDDLSSLKKHMQDIIAGIPMPDAPYARENENWQLPSYTCKDDMGIRPIDVTYTARYSVDASMRGQAAGFQKQMMDAQAKGDYETMMKISQQMQQQAMQVASTAQAHTPVDLTVSANVGDSGTIDPDAVIRDGEGFIALRTSKDDVAKTENVSVYFDPVGLKNAHQLASFDTGGDFRVQSTLDLYSLRVDLSGSTDALDKIVNGMDASKMLGNLTASRKNVENTD